MTPATAFEGRKVALFGLGGSGIATAHSLVAGGAEVIAWDDNGESIARAEGESLAVADLSKQDWSDLAALILAPGVPLTHPRPHRVVDLAHGAGLEIIGDIELFARERARAAPDAPMIAITGTNGKSTTTALIGHIVSASGRNAQIGGNIGKAILSLDPPAQGRVHVIECSSYQIDLAPSLAPTAGILLNLAPDHLDRHGDMDRYAAIKERLVAHAGSAIVGVDDRWSKAIADGLEKAGGKVIRISTAGPVENGYWAQGGSLFGMRDGEPRELLSLDGIESLRGRHNAQNALAALAACLEIGMSLDEISQGMASFPGLAHRMERVGQAGDVVFVNDSKATNADAAATALASYDRIYWIAGGLAKEGGIASLEPLFGRIAKAYLIGEAAPAFAATLGAQVAYEIAGTLDRAVALAAADASGDDAGERVVLFSPACASFDQFRNFEVRGDAFRQAVHAVDGIQTIGGLH